MKRMILDNVKTAEVLKKINDASSIEELPLYNLKTIEEEIFIITVNVFMDNDCPISKEVIKGARGIAKRVTEKLYKYGSVTDGLQADDLFGCMKYCLNKQTLMFYNDVRNELKDDETLKNLVKIVEARRVKADELNSKMLKDKLTASVENMKQAKTVKELPRVYKSQLKRRIMGVVYSTCSYYVGTDLLFDKLTDFYMENYDMLSIEKLMEVFKKYADVNRQGDYMFKIMSAALMNDDRLRLLACEVVIKQVIANEIEYQEYQKTMEAIYDAKYVSELPKNISESNLVSYLVNNSKIYPDKDKISVKDLKDLARLLLLGKDCNPKDLENQYKIIAIRNYHDTGNGYLDICNKISKLPKLSYLINEINAYNEKKLALTEIGAIKPQEEGAGLALKFNNDNEGK